MRTSYVRLLVVGAMVLGLVPLHALPGQSAIGDRIAFSWEVAGSFDIWTISPDGTDPIRVTYEPGTENDAAWSPDGSKIAYVADSTAIRVVSLDGSGTPSGTPTTIYTGTSLNRLDWSPDGSKIAFSEFVVADGNYEVKTVDVDGTNPQNLTNTASVQEGEPQWSPDGTKLAFIRTGGGTSDIWLLEAANPPNQTRLTFDGASKPRIRWQPDGSAVAYSPTSGPGLMSVDVATLAVAQIAPGVGVRGWDWSADMTTITYAGPLSDLYVRDGTVTNITNSGVRVFYPEWFRAPTTGSGTVTVVVETVPDGAPFSYTYSGPFDGEPAITDGGSMTVAVAEGTYTVDQTGNGSGFVTTNVTCDDTDSTWAVSPSNRVTVRVLDGENVTCTFTNRDNQPPGFPDLPLDPLGPEYSVVQSRPEDPSVPDAGDVTIDVTVDDNYTLPGSMPVTCTASRTDGAPVPGLGPPDADGLIIASYAVGTTSVTCTATDEAGNIRNVTFEVQVQSWAGTITIRKYTYPPNLMGAFDLTGAVTATLEHSDELTVTVDPNTEPTSPTNVAYEVIEGSRAGWAVATMLCDDTDSGQNPNGATSFQIWVSPREEITCSSWSTPVSPVVWGRNVFSQLGLGSTYAHEPRFMGWVPPDDIADILLSQNGNSFMRLDDGTLWAVGFNRIAGVGDSSNGGTGTPRQVRFEDPIGMPVPATVTVLGSGLSGGQTIFAATAEGDLWAWGRNGFSASTATIPGSPNLWEYQPVRVPGLWSSSDPIVHISEGTGTVMVTTASGKVYAWGYPKLIPGQDPTGGYVSTPVEADITVAPDERVLQVTTFGSQHYALVSDGTVLAWGQHDEFNGIYLGVGPPPTSTGFTLVTSTPTPVLTGPGEALTGVVDVAPNGLFTVALRADGSVWTWGGYVGGTGFPVLGDGVTESSAYAIPTIFTSNAIEIDGADNQAGVKTADGRLWGWGSSITYWGLDGGYGTGRNVTIANPTPIGGLAAVDVWDLSGFHGMATATAPGVPIPLDGAFGGLLSPPNTITTDWLDQGAGATPDDPIETIVSRNQPGTVSIQEVQHETLLNGFELLDSDFNTWQVDIDVDGADAPFDDPMIIAFQLETSTFGPGPFTVAVVEDGAVTATVLPDCDDPEAVEAIPGPRCIASQGLNGASDWEIIVHATNASSWRFGVNNPTADPGGPYSGEAGAVTLDATGSNTPSGGTLNYEWVSDLVDDPTSPTPSFIATDVGMYNITLFVVDENGRFDGADTEIELVNTPPSLSAVAGPYAPAAVGTPLTVTASITDPNTSDSHALSVNWGDGQTTAGTVDGLEGTGAHIYAAPGVYEVTMTVADEWGGTDTASFRYVVVYDPNGGFATGGGWFIPGGGSSNPGDVLPGLDNASKAIFGFVVKYQNGASATPGGTLTFHYNVGGFKLKSTDMEWLVVTNGNWAKFQGGATINGGSAIYPFRVDARDDPNGTDRFVIKIYAPGADPDVDEPIYKASGDLGGGNIKIHD